MSTFGATESGDGREETSLERLDRNLAEMTGELRVVVTGVQVLFAFLLVVPFDSRFAGIGPFERTVYFVTLILAAMSALFTIAPSASHRFLFRTDDKQHIVFSGAPTGAATGAAVAIPFALLWFILPLRRRVVLRASERAARARERPGGESR